jgi:hypothetical protein
VHIESRDIESRVDKYASVTPLHTAIATVSSYEQSLRVIHLVVFQHDPHQRGGQHNILLLGVTIAQQQALEYVKRVGHHFSVFVFMILRQSAKS